MPKADAAAATEETIATDETADNGAPDATTTPSDSADARPNEQSQPAEHDGDDSLADSDPLLLAQQEPTSEAKPAPAAAKPAAKPVQKPDQRAADQARKDPATAPDAEPLKTDTTAKDDVDEDAQLATSDLPAEDWQKLSHKAKSQFLAQRKVLKAQRDATKQVKDLSRFRTDFESVEKFVKDQGLENQEYVNGVAIAGAAKRNDARVLPMLEQTIARIRQANNLPDPATPPAAAPAAPAINADELGKLLEEAESSFDFTKLRALQEKLKAPPAAAKPQAAAPVIAPATAPAAPTANAEVSENMAILDALVALGVPADKVVEHTHGLIGDIAKSGPIPAVGGRLQAVLRAHQVRQSVPAARPQTKPSSTPLSARRGPVTRPGRSDPNTPVDPLKHAISG